MLRTVSRKCLAVALLALAPVVFAGCDEEDPNPTPIAPDPVTETLTGSITRNGAETKTFTVAASGTVTATLKALGGADSLAVGFSLGSWIADACSIGYAKDDATEGFALSATMSGAGTLCVRVYDVGNIPAGESVAYSVEVVHP